MTTRVACLLQRREAETRLLCCVNVWGRSRTMVDSDIAGVVRHFGAGDVVESILGGSDGGAFCPCFGEQRL